jgi:hypothetical protein
MTCLRANEIKSFVFPNLLLRTPDLAEEDTAYDRPW